MDSHFTPAPGKRILISIKDYEKNNTTLGKVTFISLLAVAVIAIGANIDAVSSQAKKLDTTAIELTYKAKSPLGGFGGVALPASCESSAWNANGGYHLDGVTADPGNCAAVAPKVAADGKCGSSDGVEQAAAPASGLCAEGTASTVSGSGPWNWSCAGVDGGATVSCSSPKQNPRNDPPERPVISGDAWAIAGQTTSNWITSTDPEADNIFYELDWDCNGSVDGTTGSYASGASAPIGHTYGSVGTYNVCGVAVQADDTSKRSQPGNYTIRVTNGTCTSPANACGVTNGNVVGGQCVAPGLPAGYGNPCDGPANRCNMTTGGGTIGCDGTCSDKTAPANTLCGCTGPANICGMTNVGNYDAAGTTCLATRPSNTLCGCTSAENACGMTATGNFDAAGTTCLAAVPSDSLCPAPGVGTTINDFRASPKLIAVNKTSKLYWDITGNRRGCTITYTRTPGGPVTVVVPQVMTNAGSMDTTPISEKRYYHLTCGSEEREAVISVFSLTEI